VLAGLSVSGFLRPGRELPYLHPADSLATVVERFDEVGYPVLPVVDGEKRLQGVVVLDEVHLAAQAGNSGAWLLAADLMRPTVRPLLADDRLDRAMELFAENDLLALPVVDTLDQRHVMGLVRRLDVARAYLRQLHARPEPPSVTL
jgi:CBS domain-containing protein